MMTVQLWGGASGSFFTGHDARYQYAADMHGGTLVDNAGNPAAFSRRTMAAAGTTAVAGEFSIDAHWRAVALRWAFCAEAAGTGNVVFRVRYGLVYPLLGQQAKTISLTTIAIPATSTPTSDGGSKYLLPDETAAIETPVDGFIGTSPIMTYSIDRLGDDAADTATAAIGLYVATITRAD